MATRPERPRARQADAGPVLTPAPAPAPASAPGPLRPAPLCELIADDLRARILRRALRPGERLDEAALSAEYGVSRTPLRQALRLLCHEGLLQARPRRGMAVAAQPGPDELQEARALLGLLQAHAGAAGRPAAAGPLLAQLLQLVEQRLQLGAGGAARPQGRRPAG